VDSNVRRPYRWFALFSLFSLFSLFALAPDEHSGLYLTNLSFLWFLLFLLPARSPQGDGNGPPA
jgi:hypothetical protein